MTGMNTVFASTDNFTKGGVEIIGQENAGNYAFSNMFEIASAAAPWERIVAAQNLEFVIEVVRMEGDSPWYACSHDETVLLMQGSMQTHFIKPEDAALVPSSDTEGAIVLEGEPAGQKMGHVSARRGHMTLLPAGAAYQMRSSEFGVGLIQTIKGAVSVERWNEICQR